MSLTTPPSKILLTNTTKMSLNDRFTKLDKVRSETAPAAIALNASPIARQQASNKNRMLAVQMAQRPSVQAALKFKQNNLKNRLSGGGGVAPKRLGTNVSPTKPANLARRLSGGNGGIVGGGRGLAGRVQFKPRRASLPPNRQSPRVFTNSKMGMNRQKTLSGGKPGMMRNRPNQNPRPQKNNNNNNNGQPIKKDLDMDLDEYMSKSKSHLNADLDAYMAKSKTHLDADLDTYMAQAPQ